MGGQEHVCALVKMSRMAVHVKSLLRADSYMAPLYQRRLRFINDGSRFPSFREWPQGSEFTPGVQGCAATYLDT